MATFAGKTYTNGNVPASILAPLDGENYGDAELRRDAAESWNRARAEVKAKTGVVLTVRGWNRTLAEQERFFFERYAPTPSGGIDVRWYKGVRYSRVRGAPAAIPGTSNHGWGLAVDIDDFGAYGTSGNARSRLATPILEKHGWTDNEGSSIGEPWHRVYSPAKDTHPAPVQEDDMTPAESATLNATKAIAVDIRSATAAIKSAIESKVGDIGTEDGLTWRTAFERLLVVTRRTEARVELLTAANAALAKSIGIDPKVVTATVDKAVTAALEDLKITLSTEG